MHKQNFNGSFNVTFLTFNLRLLTFGLPASDAFSFSDKTSLNITVSAQKHGVTLKLS